MNTIKHMSAPQQAVRLLAKGLDPKNSTLRRDQQYRELLAKWGSDLEFRQLVEALAPMVEVRIARVTDQAIILCPDGPDSVFALSITELRSGMNNATKGTLALVHVAIAATFFPTSDGLADATDGPEPLTVTPTRVAKVIKEHCERLEAQASKDEDLVEAGLTEGWRELHRLPVTRPDPDTDGTPRAGIRSLSSLAKLVLNQLESYAMVQNVGGEGEDQYRAKPRYRVQIEELAANKLFDLCMQHVPGFSKGE